MKAPAPIIVTDHALVRYLERVMGFDLNHIRAEIEKAVWPLGNGKGRRTIKAGGFTYILSNNYVTTVLDRGMRTGAVALINGAQKDAR